MIVIEIVTTVTFGRIIFHYQSHFAFQFVFFFIMPLVVALASNSPADFSNKGSGWNFASFSKTQAGTKHQNCLQLEKDFRPICDYKLSISKAEMVALSSLCPSVQPPCLLDERQRISEILRCILTLFPSFPEYIRIILIFYFCRVPGE